jgi:hypothetical protein
MKRIVPTAVAVVAALTTLVASGCASRHLDEGAAPRSGAATDPSDSLASGAQNTPRLVPAPTKNDCADFTASVKAGTVQGRYPMTGDLPPGAHPVSLLECVDASQDAPGQGQWRVVDTVRSTGPVDGFVNALRAAYVKPPTANPTGDHACPAIGYAQRWLALVDADGTAYQIRIPMGGVCLAPNSDVLKALDAIPTTVASTERIQQTTSPGAQSSGCPQQFAEMAFVAAQSGPVGTTRPFFLGTSPVKDLRACFYKIAGAADKNDPKPAGGFTSDVTLTGSQAAAVRDGLMNAPVAADAKTCAAPATQYAVLFDDGGAGDWSVVELDGCKLAAPDAGADRQAPAAVIELLLPGKK